MTPAPFMPRWIQPLIWAVALGIAIVVSLLLTGLYHFVVKPPPFSYSAEVYLPSKPVICPGDTVTWLPALTVERTPTLLMVARTLWDVSEDRTVVPDKEPRYFVWMDAQRGQTLSSAARYTLPKTLNPGLYEIHSAATATDSGASAYRVPFVIAESCFKDVKK